MIALRARQASTYNTEETFNFYVDPSGGSDTIGSGSKALPWASLQHALANMGSGQSVGLKAGTTNRVTSSITNLPAGTRIGCYGCLPSSANMPIISGGALVSGFSAAISGYTGTGGQPTITQTATEVASATTTSASVTLSSTPTAGNTLIMVASNGKGFTSLPAGFTQAASVLNPNTGVIIGTRTVQAGDSKTWTTTASSTVYLSIILYEISNFGAIDQLNTASPGQSPYTAASVTPTGSNTLVIACGSSNAGTGSSYTNTMTTSGWTLDGNSAAAPFQPVYSAHYNGVPSSGATLTGPTFGSVSGGGVGALVSMSIAPAPATAVRNLTYSASFSPTNAPSFIGWTTGGQTTGLTKGSAANTLTTNQWFYSSGTLYINLGGVDPSTGVIEAAVNRIFQDNTAGHDRITFRGVSLRYGWDQGVALYNNHGHIFDRCEWCYIGYVSDSGCVALANYTNANLPALFARITRCNIHHVMNDGGWSHAIPNLQVDNNTISNIGYLSGDVQSDGWQTEDISTDGFTYNSSAGLWIHHNTIDMAGTNSPKGCILYNGFGGSSGSSGDSGIIEYNVCKGGQYGVASHASNTVVRYNTLANQVTTSGGGIHCDTTTSLLDNVQWIYNLIYSSNRSGIIVQGTTNSRTNHTIRHNTIVNSSRSGIDVEAPLSGIVSDNIIWWTSGNTPSFAAVVQFSSGAALPGALTWNNNLMNDGLTYKGQTSHGTGTYTTYGSVTAWRSGTGFDGTVITADPEFVDSMSNNYRLSVGSPAISAATDGSNIGALMTG
jgi:hypothetical protein